MNPIDNQNTSLAAEPSGGQEPLAPLGMGDFEGDLATPEPLVGSDESQKLNTGTILIVVVIIVAAVGLFSMRKLSQATTQTQAATGLEALIDGFLSGRDDGEDGPVTGTDDARVIRVLKGDYAEKRIPWNNVRKDPFDSESIFGRRDVPGTVEPDPTNVGPTEAELMKAELTARFEKAGTFLFLRSIMVGPTPLANVNNRVVREGETIHVPQESVDFEVTRITPEAVTLLASDDRYQVVVEVVLRIARK